MHYLSPLQWEQLRVTMEKPSCAFLPREDTMLIMKYSTSIDFDTEGLVRRMQGVPSETGPRLCPEWSADGGRWKRKVLTGCKWDEGHDSKQSRDRLCYLCQPRGISAGGWHYRRTQSIYSYTSSKEEIIYRNAPQRHVSKAAATTVPPDALSLFTT